MLRFLLICINLGLFHILTLPILGLLYLLGLKWPKIRYKTASVIVRSAFRFFLGIAGTKISIIGAEQIPDGEAVMYALNHRSFFDILISYTSIPGEAGFVAKKELGQVPVFRIWMKYIHCLFLDREDVRQGLQTINAGAELIKSGTSMFIFPEGTRNKNSSDLELMEFHNGSMKMATKAGCKIIPVAISNSCQIFEEHFPKVVPQHIIIEFGKPIDPSLLDRKALKDLGGMTRGRILTMLTENQNKL